MDINNNNNIVNLSNSILKNFGIEPFHNTISEIDELLKSHKKVVVCLYDGLGKYIREKHNNVCKNLMKHRVHTMNSTFPPTTVAATTGFLTGKFPVENGWMSWTQYFEEYNCNINVFRNQRTSSGEIIRPRENSILGEICPRKSIIDIINETRGKKIAYDMSYFGNSFKGPKSLFLTRLKLTKLFKNKDELFMYYYNAEPDHSIHWYGVNDRHVKKLVKKFDRFTMKLAKKNKDILFIVISDHGLIDVDYLDISKYPDLLSTLVENKPVSMEHRCPTFFVKEDRKEEFKNLFQKYFGEHFDLYSKQEVLDKKLFGEGNPNKYFDMFIGDFLAVSKDKYCIIDSRGNDALIKGRHAGGTKEEMEIDISVFNK